MTRVFSRGASRTSVHSLHELLGVLEAAVRCLSGLAAQRGVVVGI